MAMKKKFLGLAMAAMVAIPATGVYAAETASTTTPGYKTVTTTDPSQNSLETEIEVNGEVLTSANQSGKIQVEIPTAMEFKVNADSNVEGPRYDVKNSGADSIEISVASFTPAQGNIYLHTAEEITSDSASGKTSAKLGRNHVSLILNGQDNGTATSVDLGKIATGVMDDNKVATIAAGGKQTITLTGSAGLKEDETIDKTGTSGDFNLSFKITKVTRA